MEHSASQHEEGPPRVSQSPERPQKYPGIKRGRKKGVKQHPPGWVGPADWKPTGPAKGTKRPPRSATAAVPGPKRGFKRHPDRRWGRPKGSKNRQLTKSRYNSGSSSGPSNQGSEPSNLGSGPPDQGRRGIGDLDDIFSDLGSFDSHIEKVVGNIDGVSPPVATSSVSSKPQRIQVQRFQDLFSQFKEAHPERPESSSSPQRVEGSASHPLEAVLQPATGGSSKTRKRKRLPKGHQPSETETHTILGKFKPGWKPVKANQPVDW